MANQSPAAIMPCIVVPAVPPALAAGAGGRIKKQRAGLPKLLHKLFIKVLRLRPPVEPAMGTAFEAFYGYRMAAGLGEEEEEYCYCYSYGGAGSSSWAGVLSSIPEEEVDDDDDDHTSEEGSSPDVVAPAVLRKAKSERFVVGPPEAATVVHVEVLL